MELKNQRVSFFSPLKVPGVNLIRLHFAQNYLDFEIPAAPLGRWGAWARERGYAGGQVGERASELACRRTLLLRCV